MRRFLRKGSCLVLVLLLVVLILPALDRGYPRGGGGNLSNAGDASRLFKEASPIEVEGNEILRIPPAGNPYIENRNFNPQALKTSQFNKNGFKSFSNAANRLLDIELAACVAKAGQNIKHLGYLDDLVWTDPWLMNPGTGQYEAQFPDTMPATADNTGTDGTQFLQLILPFEIDGASLFDPTKPNLDYLKQGFLTIEDENGSHVSCTVLVNGQDAAGNGPGLYLLDPEWPQLKGINIDPGQGKSSIVFIAQTIPGLVGDVPDHVPFDAWAFNNEIRIRLMQANDVHGNLIDLDAMWLVFKQSGIPDKPAVMNVEAIDTVLDENGNTIKDPIGGHDLVRRATNFILRFNKPVIPETVGQSIVFGGAPLIENAYFNGNTAPIPTSLALKPPPPPKNPCADNGAYFDPIASNVTLLVELIHPDGSPAGWEAVIPFRCHPLHQNNLSTYVLNPLIDLPASSNLGHPPFKDPQVTRYTRVRLTVQVFVHDQNKTPGQPPFPVNMGACGYFRETMGGSNFSRTFVVASEGRLVNAPVSPNALYYVMGTNGLGVVDLDGNGFTTNAPDFSKQALVTSQKYYNRFGNNGMGIGNDYSYGAKLTGGPPYIGLGGTTPMPGINEGSTGIDEVVRDSLGDARLFPGANDNEMFFNITDVEVGDFLDTLFNDEVNPWAHETFHISVLDQVLVGRPNNFIATPPTPNPPPLTIPIAMGATHVMLDTLGFSEEGAFVIMGKEVFTSDLKSLTGGAVTAPNTGFIHLWPAEQANSLVDETYPPNPSVWGNVFVDFMNMGPVANSSTIGVGMPYGSRQQIGNFLFAADKANNAVRVINSNTMEPITSLTGLSAPDSMAVTSDLRRLYVTNSGRQSVAVYNVDPRTDRFLDLIATIPVGETPRGICSQPDLEDLFVCNFGSSTISIIDLRTNTVRKTLASLLNKPWDMVAGPRQTIFGFMTGVYNGYISNFGGDNVLVFESGPDGFGGIGFDDIIGAVPDKPGFRPIQAPRGICWDPLRLNTSELAGGCFVAHRSGGRGVVSRIQFTNQLPPKGPIFLKQVSGVPNFRRRVFEITAQWGGPLNPLSGSAATDVALLDYNRDAWLNENWLGNFYVTNLGDLGNNPMTGLPVNNKHPVRYVLGSTLPTVLPDRLYISFQDTPSIDVVDPEGTQVLKTITHLPAGAIVLKSYFK